MDLNVDSELTLGLQDAEDLASSQSLDLRNTLGVTKDDTYI